MIDSGALVGLPWALLWWLPPLILLAGSVKALLPWVRGRGGEAVIGRALARRFPTVVNDVILPNGRGGLTQVDHLALTGRGILVVETKTYSGTILGSPSEATWTQIVGPRRNVFQNPLRQNYAHTQAVGALGLGVPVHPLVVFAGDAKFPRGIPDGACNRAGLRRALEPFVGEPTTDYRAAWGRLMTLALTDREARARHLDDLEARFGGTRSGRAPAVIATIALAWLVIGWLWTDTVKRDPDQSVAAAPAPAPSPRPVLPPPPRPPKSEPPVVRPAPVPPQRIGSAPPVARPAPVSAPASDPRAASIAWSESQTKDDACTLATTAYLIERTAAARQARTRACATRAERP